MSPVLRLSRTSDATARAAQLRGSVTLREAGVAARAHRYSGIPGMALIVVPDGSCIPTAQHFHQWARTLAGHGYDALRTGALSPRQGEQAERAGLRCVQELALLELTAPSPTTRPRRHTHRLRRRHLSAIAGIDRAAFGPEWSLDADLLADVRNATPTHRGRIVRDDAGPDVAGFLISGRAGRSGYVQRLAVHPRAHRRGVATDLLLDSLRWMHRAHLQRVFVNTHVDNVGALALYRAHGFVELPERLRVFEGPIPL